ncbi:MAG: yecA family protein, partial [Cellvibrionaceae bacterium]
MDDVSQTSDLLAFDDFCDLLLPSGALNSPAELHGLLCGKLCGGAQHSEEKWQKLAWELLDTTEPPDPEALEQTMTLLKTTQDQLGSRDYHLQPYLPEDDSDLDQRVEALSQWCHGFLSGFGSAGIDPNTQFSSLHADALRDLAAIVQATVDNSDNESPEKQETNYFELVEYVRMVAMSFYEDHQLATVKPVQTKSADYGHK